jgi:ferritin
MLIGTEMAKAIVEQVGVELHNASVYYLFGVWFDLRGLPDWAGAMRNQAAGERSHATRFQDFLIRCNVKFDMPEIPKVEMPKVDDGADVLESVLKLEQSTTARIQTLLSQANDLSEWATCALLLPYIDEQVQEENQARDWAANLEAGTPPYLAVPQEPSPMQPIL